MSTATGKGNKLRQVCRIKQMLRRWREKAALSSASLPPDVPAGHVAVCLVPSCKRFVVRAKHLNHPIFKDLLAQAEEEYGFANSGPLAIPCDDSLFEQIVRAVSSDGGGSSARLPPLEDCRFMGMPETRPLLRGILEKSVC